MTPEKYESMRKLLEDARAGDQTAREALVREVMTRDDIRCCPHGRPVLIRLSKGQLERQFGRS